MSRYYASQRGKLSKITMVYMAVQDNPNITERDLYKKSGVNPGAVTVSLQQLVKRGYLLTSPSGIYNQSGRELLKYEVNPAAPVFRGRDDIPYSRRHTTGKVVTVVNGSPTKPASLESLKKLEELFSNSKAPVEKIVKELVDGSVPTNPSKEVPDVRDEARTDTEAKAFQMDQSGTSGTQLPVISGSQAEGGESLRSEASSESSQSQEDASHEHHSEQRQGENTLQGGSSDVEPAIFASKAMLAIPCSDGSTVMLTMKDAYELYKDLHVQFQHIAK